jgi:hypothetical protein
MLMRSFRLLIVSAMALGLLAGTANAGGISSGVPYSMTIGVGGNTLALGDLSTTYVHSSDGTGGTYTLNGPITLTNPDTSPLATVQTWDSTYAYDPQVTNNFTVVNNSLVAQIFTVSVTSPIAAVSPTSLMRGSIGITLTDEGPLNGLGDTDGSASLTSVLGTDTYRAFLDGVAVQSLFPDAYSQSCGSGNCTDTQNASFGIPVRIAGPGATSTMGITVQFLLSPGDSASVTSVFNIIPVPEPSTAVTVGLGLVGLAIARRRRSA